MRFFNLIHRCVVVFVIILLVCIGTLSSAKVNAESEWQTGSATPASANSPSAQTQLLTTTDTSSLTVDSQVEENLASDGTSDFWIELRQAADYQSEPSFSSKAERGAYVYRSLKNIASNSQSRLITYLNSHGLKYDSHWIINSILVYHANQAELNVLKTYPEVLAIKNRFSIQLDDTTEAPKTDTTVADTAYVNWGLSFTHADEVWSTYNDYGKGIVVANIDTGVDASHPALVNQYRGTITGSNNYNWYAPLTDSEAAPCANAATAPCDSNGHGTHTMGIMVGLDGANQTGMAPQAEWIACMGCTTSTCTDTDLTACAEWILAPTDLNGKNADPSKAPDIVNNSWGGGYGNNWFESYVKAWVAAGIFPSFSAGNKSSSSTDCGNVTSPGDYTESFASGAIDSTGAIASFSSHGPGGFNSNLKPDLVAPGVSIISTYNDGSYHIDSGTSMAAPHTAGAVALLWSEVPGLKNKVSQTITLLYQSANSNVPADNQCGSPASTTTPNDTYGYGYLDAFQLIKDGLAGFSYTNFFSIIIK